MKLWPGHVRIVLDTNIFISALITEGSPPDRLYRHWEAELFSLITSQEQLAELQRVVRYSHLERFISFPETTALLESIDAKAQIVGDLPTVSYSPDPDDNIILATAIAGEADYLVSGDKQGLLLLKNVEGIPIITAREALDLLD